MLTIVASIFVLGLLITVHEAGHFLMAKKMGVGVEKFSIGFGKPIYKKTSGETEYMVSWIPLGGYVKMVGDEEDGEEVPQERKHLAYNHKPVWRRLLIVAAGPLSNLLFAAFLFAVVFMAGVQMPTTAIHKVLEDSPASSVGLVAGDIIEEIDGVEIADWNQLAELISKSPGKEISLTVRRTGGAVAHIKVTPDSKSAKTIFGEEIRTGRIGISPEMSIRHYNPFHAVYMGFMKTGEIIYLTGMVIVKIFQNVVPANTIGGPLMILKIAGDQAQAGLIPLIMFMAVLSVNLGVLNFLPIPILDGGHIFFLAIEAVKGSPVSLKGREIAQQVGMFLLILLMVFAFYNDISRFLAG